MPDPWLQRLLLTSTALRKGYGSRAIAFKEKAVTPRLPCSQGRGPFLRPKPWRALRVTGNSWTGILPTRQSSVLDYPATAAARSGASPSSPTPSSGLGLIGSSPAEVLPRATIVSFDSGAYRVTDSYPIPSPSWP